MSNKAIMSMIGTVIVAAGLLASNNAEATVRICGSVNGVRVCVCFTGKKNPDGCKDAVAAAASRGMQVVVLEDDVMANMEKMKGQAIKVEAVPAIKEADTKASKFKAGKALADTVKRNSNREGAGSDAQTDDPQARVGGFEAEYSGATGGVGSRQTESGDSGASADVSPKR